MKARWKKLERFLKEKTPNVYDVLNEGIEPSTWANFESNIGTPLPQDFKDFYAIHNGLAQYDAPFFFSLGFLRQDFLIEEWNEWVEVLDQYTPQEMIEDYDIFVKSEMPDKVKAVYVNKKWIPFATDWSGNFIGVDLDPEPKGKFGQVINFGVDEESHFVLADSFTAFIDWMLKQIDDGNYYVKPPDEDGHEVLYIKEPDIFFIDAVRQLIKVQ